VGQVAVKLSRNGAFEVPHNTKSYPDSDTIFFGD
jgi:hypothetical protein